MPTDSAFTSDPRHSDFTFLLLSTALGNNFP